MKRETEKRPASCEQPAGKRHSKVRLGRWAGKNLFTAVLTVIGLLMFFSPGAKTWVLKKFMWTGLLNARMENTGNFSASARPAARIRDFSVETAGGQVLRSDDLQGKVVFISFWATWCPPCLAEMPSIQQLYDTFKNDPDVFFLLINEDNSRDYRNGKVRAFMQKNRYTLPVYRLRTPVDASVYSGRLPTTLVLDRQGHVRYKKEGIAGYGSERFLRDFRALTNGR